jgi:hypothetical protein
MNKNYFEKIKNYLLENGSDFTGEVTAEENKQVFIIDQNIEGIGEVDATVIFDNEKRTIKIDELFYLKRDESSTYLRDEEIIDTDIKNQFLENLVKITDNKVRRQDIKITVHINHPPSDKEIQDFRKVLDKLISDKNLKISQD